jgi:hypothetical protein
MRMRRPDRVRAAAGSCRQMRLVDAWRIPSAGDFQHTLSRSCGRLWPRPPFELALYSAEVREGSYPNEPHLRVPPSIAMVPRSRRVPPFVRCAPWHPLNSAKKIVCPHLLYIPMDLIDLWRRFVVLPLFGVAGGRVRRSLPLGWGRWVSAWCSGVTMGWGGSLGGRCLMARSRWWIDVAVVARV